MLYKGTVRSVGRIASRKLGYEGGTLPSTDIIAAEKTTSRFGFDVWKVMPSADNIALGFSFEALEIRKIDSGPTAAIALRSMK